MGILIALYCLYLRTILRFHISNKAKSISSGNLSVSLRILDKLVPSLKNNGFFITIIFGIESLSDVFCTTSLSSSLDNF
jgi:hypothetical protein